jgi:hypothetical protein
MGRLGKGGILKRILLFSCAAILLFGMVGTANAILIDRGNGMIYSTDMDVTWVQNANLAGNPLTWEDANAWADNLSYGGYDDWRLPTFDPAYNRDYLGDDPSIAADLSELAYLRFAELGPPYPDTDVDPAPFFNLGFIMGHWYWGSAEDVAWRFDFT